MESNNGSGVHEDGGRMSETAHTLQAQLSEKADRFREVAGDAETRVREFAQEKPLLAVGIAVGLGFLLGRLLSRA
jgi:ElaB/YqjD/DUF883 family membrane-anchored ribosome-binding protein